MIHIEIPKFEGKATTEDRATVPRKPGIYALFGFKNELLYIGKAANLFTRIPTHLLGNDSGTCRIYFEDLAEERRIKQEEFEELARKIRSLG